MSGKDEAGVEDNSSQWINGKHSVILHCVKTRWSRGADVQLVRTRLTGRAGQSGWSHRAHGYNKGLPRVVESGQNVFIKSLGKLGSLFQPFQSGVGARVVLAREFSILKDDDQRESSLSPVVFEVLFLQVWESEDYSGCCMPLAKLPCKGVSQKEAVSMSECVHNSESEGKNVIQKGPFSSWRIDKMCCLHEKPVVMCLQSFVSFHNQSKAIPGCMVLYSSSFDGQEYNPGQILRKYCQVAILQAGRDDSGWIIELCECK
ncbi:hypothetical protein C8J57DRAFT_1234299 [Mycena rebaudengoi]|nr:hypothetical protein C8J57DRAFT_1234299 [Mycena rebaudengoi]